MGYLGFCRKQNVLRLKIYNNFEAKLRIAIRYLNTPHIIAYYLVTEVSYGEGFGVATSEDGQHWTDHGYVWHGPSWWNHTPKFWEGSSAVWRAADFNETGEARITLRIRVLTHPFRQGDT